MGRTQPAAEPGPLATEVTGRRVAWASPATALGAVVLMLMIAAEILIVLDHELTIVNTVTGPAAALTFAGVGVVVARHQPRNPVGWILILVASLTPRL